MAATVLPSGIRTLQAFRAGPGHRRRFRATFRHSRWLERPNVAQRRWQCPNVARKQSMRPKDAREHGPCPNIARQHHARQSTDCVSRGQTPRGDRLILLIESCEESPAIASRHKRTAPRLCVNEPTSTRWVPSSPVPASLTTKDACTEYDCVGSLKKRDGSPSCSTGCGTPSSYRAEYRLPVLTYLPSC